MQPGYGDTETNQAHMFFGTVANSTTAANGHAIIVEGRTHNLFF
jgi:hypothetical protein